MKSKLIISIDSASQRFFSSQGFLAYLYALCVSAVFATSADAAEGEKITFVDHVQPIFREHCYVCHDTDGKSGGLAIDSMSAIMAGGAGGDVVEPGSADGSRLFNVIVHTESPAMPPDSDKIPAAQIEIIRKWIDGGLLETSSSVAKLPKKSAVGEFTPTENNRPAGEPAMPVDAWCEPVLTPDRAGAAQTLAASPWAPLVAIGGQRQVSLYHAQSQQLLGILPFLEGVPQVIRFSRNGDLLLVAGGRGGALGKVALFDVKSGRRLTTLGDEVDVVLAADVLADHSLVALGGPRRKVRVLRTADGETLYEIAKHTDWVTSLEFSPDGKWLATADRGGNAYLWEAATGRPVASLSGHKDAITSVSWRADSKLVATASDDTLVKLWSPDGREVKSFNAHGGGTLSVVFTPSGKLLTAGRDRRAKLFDSNGKELASLTEMPDIALSAVATTGEKLIAVGDFSGEVRLVNVEQKQPAGTLAVNPPSLAEQIAQQTARQAELDKQLAAAKLDSQAVEQRLAAERQKLAAMQAELTASQTAKATADAEAKASTDALAVAQNIRAKAEAAMNDSRASVDGLRTKLADLQKQLAALGASVAIDGNSESQSDGKAKEETAKQEAELQQQVDTTTTALEQARAAAAKAQASFRESRDAVQSASDSANRSRKATGEMKARAKAAEQAMKNPPDLTALEKGLAESRDKVKQLEQNVADSANHAGKLQAQQSAFAAEPQQLVAEFAERSAKVEQLAAAMKGAEAAQAATQTKVDALQKQLDELQASLADVRKQKMQSTEELADVASKLEATKTRLKEREEIDALRLRVGD